MDGSEDPVDCCFDEWAASNAARARKKGTGARITAAFLEALADEGLEGRTVLDVGCGSGDLALGALARGAERAAGVDLGPGAIAQARSLAADRGLSERATFAVGDGSIVDLPSADVVTLNRVLCCYPGVDALLSNTLGAAGAVFGYTAPIDRGSRGVVNRLLIRVGNTWYALRARKFKGFRAFVHDLAAVERRIGEAGFVRVRRERRGLWDLSVFARPAD